MAPVFVIPLIAGAVGGAFAAVVGRQYLSRRKTYQAIWAIALAMFAAAALFETAGQAFGWSDATYRGYYLFGGLLNVGWLGLGSLLLLARRGTYWVLLSLSRMGSIASQCAMANLAASSG